VAFFIFLFPPQCSVPSILHERLSFSFEVTRELILLTGELSNLLSAHITIFIGRHLQLEAKGGVSLSTSHNEGIATLKPRHRVYASVPSS